MVVKWVSNLGQGFKFLSTSREENLTQQVWLLPTCMLTSDAWPAPTGPQGLNVREQ